MKVKHLLASLCLLMTLSVKQEASSQNPEVNLAGIVLASDHRCSTRPAQDDLLCRSSDWALDSGRRTYLLVGDKSTLEKFERKRVVVKGLLEEKSVVEYGTRMIRRTIVIRSIASSELTQDSIEALVNQLKVVPWRGPENYCSPMCWDFAFTDPMVQILHAGTGAQDILLAHIADQAIQDQVVMLLGGVGNERAIWPIIETLTDGEEAARAPRVKRMNLIGHLALTNLTVSEVIWHHGGGISFDRCPTIPKSCWSEWWLPQKDSFKVGIGGDRLYSNYPNYGIYAQFSDGAAQ